MAPKLAYLLFIIFFFSLPIFHKTSAQNTSNEKQILLNIKNDWGNPLSLSSWNLAGDHCIFNGIHCSGDGFVDGINLENSNISFPIPASICDLKGLTFLDLSGNNIPGEFPTVLYNCSKLQGLDISQNHFVGELPADIYNMPSCLTHLVISGNNFTGTIPPDIGRLPSIKLFDFSNNLFNGTIPVEIGNLSTLKALKLGFNRFSPAKILPEFGNLTNQSTYFNSLNLSSDDRTGEIPVPFQTHAYEQNVLLNHRSKKLSPGLLILFSILGALIFSGVLLLCFLITKERLRGKKAGAFQSDWKYTSFKRLDFNESAILNSLTDENLIGSGSSGKVYRVSLNLGNTVAVKKIHNISRLDSNIEKQFQAETKILGSIRHDNIVKLLRCISGDNSKLLVYEYLENGSLDRRLHQQRPGGAEPLDWPTKLQIAVGAAKGLCYMHHHCFPPIIHHNVKSSDILLDHNFNAKIAGFGLAKSLESGEELESPSAEALSSGYMAPEYGTSRKVTEKADVYSFGVVLLELVTEKEAWYGGEKQDDNLTDWAWRKYTDRGAVVDEEIPRGSSEWENEAEIMFKIGLMCTVDNPTKRPTMKEVMQVLMKLGRGRDSNINISCPLNRDTNINMSFKLNTDRPNKKDGNSSWSRIGKVAQTVALGGFGASITLIVNAPPSADTHRPLYAAYVTVVFLGISTSIGLSAFSVIMEGSSRVGWVQKRLIFLTFIFVALACFLRLHLVLPLADIGFGMVPLLIGLVVIVLYLLLGSRRQREQTHET